MDNIITAANDAENLSASLVARIKGFENQVAERESQAIKNAAKYGKLSGEHDPAIRRVYLPQYRLRSALYIQGPCHANYELPLN